eukprot:scaffold14558_cov137-Cylindrotheca_fusiformis.AAC.5
MALSVQFSAVHAARVSAQAIPRVRSFQISFHEDHQYFKLEISAKHQSRTVLKSFSISFRPVRQEHTSLDKTKRSKIGNSKF